MNKTRFLGVIAALGLVVTAPAQAQMKSDSMSKGAMAAPHEGMMSSGMKMSKSQKMAMHKCQAMSKPMMMKNKKCASMMKMHKGMM